VYHVDQILVTWSQDNQEFLLVLIVCITFLAASPGVGILVSTIVLTTVCAVTSHNR